MRVLLIELISEVLSLISIRFSPGFSAFIIETPTLSTYFDDTPLGVAKLIDWVRRQAIQGRHPARDADIPSNLLIELKSRFIELGGEVKVDKLSHLDLRELDL